MTAYERKIAEAIKELRGHLKESQQAFSTRLDVSVRTIARYESVRPPRGTILLRLAEASEKADRTDLASIFRDAEGIETSTRKSRVAGAVRALRAALGFTQQQLAAATDLAVSTIARAETSIIPEYTVLKKLRGLATEHNLTDIESILSKTLEVSEKGREADYEGFWYEVGQASSLNRLGENAADLLESVFDAIESLAVRENQTRLTVPGEEVPPQPLVLMAWLLSHINEQERVRLDVFLLDIAIKVLERLVVDRKVISDEHQANTLLKMANVARALTVAIEDERSKEKPSSPEEVSPKN